ncbi:MAG: septation protein A [Acidiferrobacteraceae bacterium]
MARLLFDLFPLIVFFAGFKIYGIYVATAASIVASFIQVGVFWFRHRRFETAQLITLAVVAVFGGMTLAFHNDTFIKWKLTVVDWIFGAVMLASQWIGKKNVIERMLGDKLELPRSVWGWINLSWGLFFLLMGVLNLYVAFFYGHGLDAATRRRIWVDFKVFGSTALMLAFSIVQALVIANYLNRTAKDKE